jgi:peptide/nickel transport system permease protein
MWKYIARRFFQAIPTIFILSIFVFVSLRLIPGDPVDALVSEEASEEVRQAIREEFALDRNIIIQYGIWISKFARGDFGTSILSNQPVADLIFPRLPATIYLALTCIFVSTLLAIPLGIIAAMKRKTWVDLSVMIFSLFGLSVPDFWFALVCILVFSLGLGIFPTMGYIGPEENFIQFLKYLALPALTITTHMMANITRLTRSTMLDELNSDYVRTHKAQGIPQRTINFKLALKNALIPVITIIGMRLGTVLGGTVVIEMIFSWPGVGNLILESILNRDFAVVQAASFLLALCFIMVNLTVDILYKWLDPRITLS